MKTGIWRLRGIRHITAARVAAVLGFARFVRARREDDRVQAMKAAALLYPRRFGWRPVRSLRAGRFNLIEAPRRELYEVTRIRSSNGTCFRNGVLSRRSSNI